MFSEGVIPELPLARRAVGIDYTAAYEQGAGIGRLVRDLIAALGQLDNQTPYRLFVAGATHETLPFSPGPNFRWKPTRVTPLWFARLWYRARLYWPVQAFVGDVGLFHSPDFTLPPTLPGTRTILTVHDLSYVRAPETAHPVLKAYLDRAVPWSVARADHVLADSQATKDDLVELYGTPPDKVTVLLSGVNPIYQPVDDPGILEDVRERYHIPSGVPYIFSIGTVQPRKNYERLMRALVALGNAFSDMHLVIAGGKGWLDTPIYETVKTLGIEERVHFTGYVEDRDVPALYSGAVCTAYVSLYEGFGFPVVESMACGTPVVTSNVSSLPEVAGTAALMVDPYDIDAIAEGLRRVLDDSDYRAQLVAAGFEQAARFTWEGSARQLLQVYAKVLEL
ncbi:MAG: glycosyltransferase family 4 protein [Chloroflexi bacterium]|nr:glycosyltransferase family 4 protein [Chloroflexota bacterium]